MTVISATYNDKSLGLLNGNNVQKMLWNTHPVHISPEEKKTINIERILHILQGENLLPSRAINISDTITFCALVSKLDRVFSIELQKYKEELDHAQARDSEIIQLYQRQYQIQEDVAWYARAWNHLLYKTKYIPRDTFQRETRVHRFTWLIQLDTLEKKRLEAMKESIQTAFASVITTLEQSKGAILVDKDLIRTAKQLYCVFKKHFPNDSLEKEEVIRNIINKMESDHVNDHTSNDTMESTSVCTCESKNYLQSFTELYQNNS